MTRARIKELRELLGLDPFAMAAMLGVHVSSVYRWETHKTAIPSGIQRLLLDELDKYALTTPERMMGLGHMVRNAIVQGGMLYGMRELLTHLVPR